MSAAAIIDNLYIAIAAAAAAVAIADCGGDIAITSSYIVHCKTNVNALAYVAVAIEMNDNKGSGNTSNCQSPTNSNRIMLCSVEKWKMLLA